MKEVGHYNSRTEAEMAKGFLESAGIKAHVSIDDEGGLMPALGVQKGARLLVPSEMVEKAKTILAQIDNAAPLGDDND